MEILAKWHQPGSLASGSHALLPHVLQVMTLHGYITAEITYSTVPVHHKVLAWSWVTLCSTPLWVLPWKPGCCCFGATLEWHHGYVIWGFLSFFEIAKSCLTPWDPKDYSLPGSPVHGISQERVLEWVAGSFSSLTGLCYRFMAIFGYVIAAAPARREAVSWLPCHTGENKHDWGSHSSSHLPSAS